MQLISASFIDEVCFSHGRGSEGDGSAVLIVTFPPSLSGA